MNFTAASEPSANSVTVFRERLLNVLLGLALVGAILVGGLNAYYTAQSGNIGTALVYVGEILYVALLVLLTRFPNTYLVRAWGLVLALYGASAAAFLATGVRGDGRVWLVGVIIMGAIFLPPLQSVLNSLLAGVYYFSLAYAFSHGLLALPPGEMNVVATQFRAWTRTGTLLFALSIIIVAAIAIYRRSLENTLTESQNLNAVLENERLRLKQQERTLRRRLEQIHTASEISRVVNAILDPDRLIEEVVNLIRDRFNLYYVGIFLVDERGEYAVLRAGTGEAGRKMLVEGHRLAIGGGSMIGWSISNRKPRIALDVGEEAVRFANPHLPLTRTELALPLVSRGEVLGAVTIQSERARAFDEDDLTVLQSIVDNLAIALHNARLYQETQRSLQSLAQTHYRLIGQSWEELTASGLEFEAGDDAESDAVHQLRVPIDLYGESLGEIVLENTSPWGEEERTFAKQFGHQLALTLENILLTQETQRSIEENRVLTEITERVGISLDIDTIVQTTLRELGEVLQISEAEIHLSVPETATE